MAPPAKKIKVELEPVPIIFTTPGQSPDVRLQVFTKEFHVLGVVLKTHSAFFRTRLTSGGDLRPGLQARNFSAEFFTKIEANGIWTLSCDPVDRYADISTYKGDKAREEIGFEKLLRALFGRRYTIDDVFDLKAIVEMADNLRTLPILSTSLDGSFYKNTGFHTKIMEQPCTVLVAAKKLRHEQLFLDAFICSLGPWNKPRHTALRDIDELKDEQLWLMTLVARKKMEQELLNIQRAMFQLFSRRSSSGKKGKNQDIGKQMVDIASECVDKSRLVMYPNYFRKCLEILEEEQETPGKLNSCLKHALKNNLVLDKSGQIAGEGAFSDFFLCHQIPSYPWDSTEVAW